MSKNEEADAIRVGDIHSRRIDLIIPDPDNRDISDPASRDEIASFAASMVQRGFDRDQHLMVRAEGGKYMITDGHKRFAAVLLANTMGASITHIPCGPEPKGTNEQKRALIRLRPTGTACTPLQAAPDVMKLMAWGWTIERIAAYLGRKEAWVHSSLAISETPEDVRATVRADKVATTEAIKAARTYGAEAAPLIEKAHRHAVERGKSRATAKDIAAVSAKPGKPSVKSRAAAVIRVWSTLREKDTIPLALRIALDDLAEEVAYTTNGAINVHQFDGPSETTSEGLNA